MSPDRRRSSVLSRPDVIGPERAFGVLETILVAAIGLGAIAMAVLYRPGLQMPVAGRNLGVLPALAGLTLRQPVAIDADVPGARRAPSAPTQPDFSSLPAPTSSLLRRS